ncbi:MAG: hypothetical protein NUV81_02245, partial [bacterium]|nr:hypothetical protein [bacterium]
MQTQIRRNGGVFILVVSLGALFFVLPSLGGRVFLSPDETANAVTAQEFAKTGFYVIPQDTLIEHPWMHPRSFVTQGAKLVPVGFLGIPVLAGLLFSLGGAWAMTFFFSFLALSVVYPLWRFLHPMGRWSQTAGLIAWLTFPTVILYANRGLFPNLAVLSFTIWAMYLLSGWDAEKTKMTRVVFGGIFTGLALSIRPVEIVWVLPWILFALWFSQKKASRSMKKMMYSHQCALFIISLILTASLFAVIGWKTYGTWFTLGYHLKDTVVSTGQLAGEQTGSVISQQTSILP